MNIKCNDGVERKFEVVCIPEGMDCWSQSKCLECNEIIDFHSDFYKETLKKHICK